MRRLPPLVALAAICCLLPTAPARATALAPFIDLQEAGLTTSVDGVGLNDLGSGSKTLTVQIGGSVRFALLYWGGRDRPCAGVGDPPCTAAASPHKDQEMVFNGIAIVGTLIGEEEQPATPDGRTNNIGYFADVTSVVGAAGTGDKSFTFADGNASSSLAVLEGAQLIVAYTDAANASTYRLLVWDGHDFAHGDDPTPGGTRVTTPVTFNHGSAAAARPAELTVLAGGGTATRTDQIEIENNATRTGCLAGADGGRSDSPTMPITIPPGDGATAVTVMSPAGSSADELGWAAAMLRVPITAGAGISTADDCPTDADGDGVPDGADNCPLAPNGPGHADNQGNLDGDALGDACDSDDDGDGAPDTDEASSGTDPRDSDSDDDGALDGADNCPSSPGQSSSQTDTDGDGMGDVCDPDDDGDGVSDSQEATLGTNPLAADSDGDGDLDAADNCPTASNPSQGDADGDGEGDACDGTDSSDPDGDGVPSFRDNCPAVANADQTNTDGSADGGDACDPDDDNDAHTDGDDNCRTTPNPGLIDHDRDGVGTACDPGDLATGACANHRNGTAGPDLLTGTTFGDRITAGDDDDVLEGRDGDDCLFGQAGDDRVIGGPGEDLVKGNDGDDILRGSSGDDRLIGGKGDDSLQGNAGRNSYSAQSGNDVVISRNGVPETVNCGAGRDVATIDATDTTRGCERVKRP